MMKIIEQFKEALNYYQQGKLEDAAAACRDILFIEPNYLEALRLLAMLHYQFHEYTIAADFVEKVLTLDPNDFYAFFLLGNIFQELGDSEKAMECFIKASQINPLFGDAFYNLAIIFEKKNDLERALTSYKQSLDINPGVADVYNNIGNVLLKMKRFDEAVLYLEKALQVDPDYAVAFVNLAMALKGQGHLDESLNCFQKALKLNPSFADAHYNLAIVLNEKNRIDEAAAHFQKAIELNPTFADAHYNFAIILKEKGRFDEAISYLQKAVEIRPSFAEAYCNLAIISEESGLTGKALSNYQKALNICPYDAEIHWNMSHSLLSSGNFYEGWREYEWRFGIKDFKQRIFRIPRWDGRYLKGRTLFIHAEQGVGEEIMFASCLPEVMARAGSCVIECDKRLVPLFSRSFPEAKFMSYIHTLDDLPQDISKPDMRIAIGSLPFFLRTNIESFPQYFSYLIPVREKVALWRDRFGALGDGIKIGISWRGGSKALEKRLRSTVLEQWKDLLSVPGVCFINLQYGYCDNELKEAEEYLGLTIHDWEDADPLKDLDGFAAQVAALDLVISVDNATVHIAGALGVPVWVLLPFASDWRWMRDFDDTPWYRTMRLFRQSRHGNWDEVFEGVASNLKQYISTGVMPEINPANSYTTIKKAETPVSPHHNRLTDSSYSRTYRCAIVTPVGPGHEQIYHESLASIEKSFAKEKAIFSEIIPIRIDDTEGKLGRSKARNIGIRKAAEINAEWIFFLDADDIMAPSAFEYVSPYLDKYDAIWGSIWPIEKGELIARERPGQLPFLYSIEDVLSFDPFVTLGIGHFVRTKIALLTPFNELLDTGEDFDYYLRVWEKNKCIKIPLPFWFHRRGFHSSGPRSASGIEWRERVDDIIRKKRVMIAKI